MSPTGQQIADRRVTLGGLLLRSIVTLCALLPLSHSPVATARAGATAQLDISVLGSDGKGVPGIVIIAEAANPVPNRHPPRTTVMDQINMRFVPDILVIQTGTGVEFPNSDRIKHQVYSFSPAKTFQLSLYAGRKYPPVIFGRSGLVVLGCNIHDNMIGYVYVTDSPFIGRTDKSGHLRLSGLPAGSYTVRAWHPRMHEPAGRSLQLKVALSDGDHAASTFRLTRPLLTDMTHSRNMQWMQY